MTNEAPGAGGDGLVAMEVMTGPCAHKDPVAATNVASRTPNRCLSKGRYSSVIGSTGSGGTKTVRMPASVTSTNHKGSLETSLSRKVPLLVMRFSPVGVQGHSAVRLSPVSILSSTTEPEPP